MEEFDHDIVEYLKEFESSIKFDGEICPTCGLDFTKDQARIAKWVKYKDDLPFEDLERIAAVLDQERIHYYFTKNDEAADNKSYMLLVLNDSIQKVDKVFSELLH